MPESPSPSAAAPDSDFLDRLRRQDSAAFEQLVRSASARLLCVARRFLRDEHEAQDALQEAFIQAYHALPRFEGRGSVPTWLHAITVRACLMRLRKRKNHPETSIESLLPVFRENGHHREAGKSWAASLPDASQTEEREIVRSSIDKLPEDYRNVILLRDIEELDTRQTAELLGETEGVIKTRLHRARQALRTLLDPYFRK